MWLLLLAHLAGILAAGIAGRRSILAALRVAALAPAVTAVWAGSRLIGDVAPTVTELVWVEQLGLSLRFRSDSLALLMTVLVSGIGAGVFVYATGYFDRKAAGGVRFPMTLLAFSTSMLGLVWADSIWTLFIFWEFTSITSFLLVGHKNTSLDVQTAARRALMITGAGGLSLLAGFLVMANQTGNTTLTNITPLTGTGATVAAVLIMIGAATKSAQVPFHVWLPGAMAAPTPVSAYLHSATMVKAGVLLVAVCGPAFADVATWKYLGLGFGIASMIWGGIGALRHRDAKLILAWGTVSQLGLLITLLAAGTAKATFAAISILFAHALFKAALFAVVGEIDIRTGTRDITKLGGLARSMPLTTVLAVAAGLSMAGVPPLLGFAAKEAAIEAALGFSGPDGVIASIAIILGSVLTVAYTIRFLIAAFGPGPNTPVAERRLAMTLPVAILSGLGLVAFLGLGVVNAIVVPAAIEIHPGADKYQLLRWPGFTLGLGISLVVVAAGATIGWALARRDAPRVPAAIGQQIADQSIDGVLRGSPKLVRYIQHGSLPVYLATMAAAAALATLPFLAAFSTTDLVLWNSPLEGLLAIAILASSLAAALVNKRLDAALTLGAVGIAMSGLFVLYGAPDLALTQLLVETIIVVGFVIGLGHLKREFPQTNGSWQVVRLGISLLGGLGVVGALVSASRSPQGEAPIERLTTGAVEVGGGKNIVNVILTDLRALDTLGEVVVLAVVAVGLLALSSHRSTPTTATPIAQSAIAQQGIQIVSPLAVLAATYLLFAGHNNPGGGFAAGLVVGAVVTLRSLSGLPQPFRAQPLVASGLALVAAVAVLPMLWGDAVLDQSVVSFAVPALGTIKSGSALPFDIGVAAIVVGLVVALLGGLTDSDAKGTEQ